MKVAIWFDAPHDYYGGINYFKNLLYALSNIKNSEVEVIMFFSKDIPEETLELFRPYANIIKTRILKRYSILWFIHQFIFRLFKSDFVIRVLLKSHSIDIVSHSWSRLNSNTHYKIITWIPDFQYLHLPELFPLLDQKDETNRWKKIISESNAVILSSDNAHDDFKTVANINDLKKGYVLNFVSQPSTNSIYEKQENLETKFNFAGKFFYLPNQFWKHKNHLIVFKAIKILKDKGVNITLICSGEMLDFRSNDNNHKFKILDYVADNDLNSIKILGKIKYIEVLSLMKSSLAVINPSYFEGWSSSVEESKSMGKKIILSDIAVHREQKPPNAIFFNPDDEKILSSILENEWLNDSLNSDNESELTVKNYLEKRTTQFGYNYIKILRRVFNEY